MIAAICLFVPPLILLIVREQLLSRQNNLYRRVLLYLLYAVVLNCLMIFILAIFFSNTGHIVQKLNTYYNFAFKYFVLAAVLAVAEPTVEKFREPVLKKIKELFSKLKNFHIENKRQYYIVYTIIFVIVTLIVFGYFFLNGKSFVWQDDGFNQHFRALLYYSKWLRTIIKTFLTEHVLEIPTFSFSIGYGSDIITALHYYVIGDPLLLPSVFVKAKYMVYYYDAVVILRFYLAGLTFSMYCFYMERKISGDNNDEGFSKIGILAGSLVYAFCGFALYAGIRHPYFMNPMIYLPLVLLGAEKILDGKKPYLFIVSVFLSAISNFYFFYMIAILTVLYVVWRLFTIYVLREWRTIICTLLKFAGYALLGICISAIIFLPAVVGFLASLRSQSGYVYDLLYTLSSYEIDIGAFIAPAMGEDEWTLMGYAAIALIAVVILFVQKKHADVKVAFLVLTAMTLLPTVGHIMNGFSYAANRWIWGYSFLIAFILVIKWKSLFSLTGKEKEILLTALGIYFLLCIILVKSRTVSVLFAMSVAFLTFGVICLTNELFNIRTVQMLLLACVVANLGGNAMFRYSARDSGYAKEFIAVDELMNRIEHDEAVAINSVSEGDDDFFRYSGSSITKNGSLYSGLHNTQYFWSLENGNIASFRSEMALSEEIRTFNYKTLDSRAALSTLANVKYYVQGSNVPYGFTQIDSVSNYSSASDYLKKNLGDEYADLELSAEDEKVINEKITTYKVWENENFLPFGYTYSGFITKDEYDEMTPLQKQETLLQGCVVDSDKAMGEAAEVDFTGQQIDYELKVDSGISVNESDDGNTIEVTTANATITLTFDGLPDSETYFYITGLNWRGMAPLDQYTDLQWELLSDYDKNEAYYSQRFYSEATSLTASLSAKNTEGSSVSKTLKYYTPRYTWYSDRQDFMINFGYDENAKTTVTITFPTVGTYTYDSMQILCQPMGAYSDQVSALAENVMDNVDFHENDAFATDRVTGTISLDEDKYLLLTIPYTTGWTAYVDGEPQELLKANSMYMALYLTAGDHDISLKYSTPGLTIGAAISVLSLLIFIAYVFIKRRKEGRTDL